MKLKSQKGSVTVFVLIALLFYTAFLLLMYAANTNKLVAIQEKSDILKGLYIKNVNDVENAYYKKLNDIDPVEPSIENIPDVVITEVTEIQEEYASYGVLGGNTEYLIQENEFNSMNDLINYLVTNNQYGQVNITINAHGKNGKNTTVEKTFTLICGKSVTNETELAQALNSTNNLYIYLQNNIECTNTKSMNNIEHKLDLNNHSITYTKTNESFSFLTIGSSGNLTILDSSEAKQGSIVSKIQETDGSSSGSDRENTIYTIENNGTLTIQSGKIKAEYYQHLNNARDSIHVRGTAVAVKNNGTATVAGAQVESVVSTNAISYGATRDSKAIGVGISNTGTINLNTGSIAVTADAYMQKQGLVYGETIAYAYGVYNNAGTVNRSNNFSITVSATAHKYDINDNTQTTTYKETQDQSEVKQKTS